VLLNGGNVAVNAAEDLSDEQRCSLRMVLMATPFLRTIRRFDVREIFNLLPASVQSNLYWIGMFSTWSACLILGTLLKDRAWAKLWFWIEVELGWLQLPIIIFLFYAPFFVFDRVWRVVKKLITEMPPDKVEHGSRTSQTLVLAYSQDEAFMALSIVVNLLSLIHQIVFVSIAAAAWVSSRFKLVDWLAELPWMVYFAVILVTMWAFTGAIVISAIAKAWPFFDVAAAPMLSIGSIIEGDYLFPLAQFSMNFFLALVLIAGLVIGLASMSMMIIGTARIVLFTLIGVMDTVRNRAEFFNAALGGVLVSMIPEGHAESMMVDGRMLFNHIRIYDDPNAQKEILRFILREAVVTKA
jgi:hypothetical protein